MIYRISKKLHLWLAVPFGFVMAISCLTGALLIMFDWTGADGSAMFRLHRWLMDVPAQRGAMTAGKLIIGISTIAFILVILSGIVMWWQRARVNFTKSLSTPLSAGVNAFVRGWHTSWGMYTALLLLIMAFTGLTWSFGWYRNGFYWLFAFGDPATLRPVVRGLHTGLTGGLATRIIWFAASLAGALLPLSGYWIWIARMLKSKHRKANPANGPVSR